MPALRCTTKFDISKKLKQFLLIDFTNFCNYNVIMKTNLVQIGNSRGVRIPKPLLEQLKFETTVEFEILPEGLLLRPVKEKTKQTAREGWDEMFNAALSENGDDKEEFTVWDQPELTGFDEKEWQ